MSLAKVKEFYQTAKESTYKYFQKAKIWVFNLPQETKILWQAKESFSVNNYLLGRYHWLQQNNTDAELRLRLVIAARNLAPQALTELALFKYRHSKKEKALQYLGKAKALQPGQELISWAETVMLGKLPSSIPTSRWQIFREQLSFNQHPFHLINQECALAGLKLLNQHTEGFKPKKSLEVGLSSKILPHELRDTFKSIHTTIIEGNPPLLPALEGLTAPTGKIYDILIKSDYNRYLAKADKASKSAKFDLAFANNSLLSEANLGSDLKNMRLLLADSGWLVASFPVTSATRLDVSYSYYVYGKEVLKASLASSGFSLIASEVVKLDEQFDEFMVILCRAK